MKTTVRMILLVCLALLVCMGTFTSCDKDGDAAMTTAPNTQTESGLNDNDPNESEPNNTDSTKVDINEGEWDPQ